jgi:hypothetical protein
VAGRVAASGVRIGAFIGQIWPDFGRAGKGDLSDP